MALVFALALAAVPAAPAIAEDTLPGGDQYLAARQAQLAGDLAAAIPGLQAVMDLEGPLRPFAAQALVDAARATNDAVLVFSALQAWADSERVRDVRVRAQRALGDHLITLDRPADAVEAYAYWLKHPKDSRDRSRARWAIAQAHVAAEELNEAHQLLWAVVHDDPSSVQARDALALLPEPTDVRRRYEVGRVHLKHRSWAKADTWLGPLVQAPMSTAFEAQVLYAWAEAQSRLVSRAEGRRAMYQLALAYPRSGYARKAWQRIASYWSRDRMYAKAVAAYDDVADHAPQHDAAVQAMWDAAKLVMRSDPIAAADRLTILHDTYPRHVLADDALRLRGLALYRAERYADARDAFRQGYTQYPRRRQADDCAYWEGRCALALGEVEDARAAFARTRAGWPNAFYAYRAEQQLRELDAETPSDVGPRILPVNLTTTAAAGDAPLFTPEDMALPDAAADWLALFAWFHANNLPEARDVIPPLRALATTPAQKFRVAQLAASGGDFESCIWLADGLRKVKPDAVGTPALAPLLYPKAWFEHVRAQATAYDVDPYLPLAVMREESHFRDAIDSVAGARGVMQIMPKTGAWLGERVTEAGPYSHDRLYDLHYNIQLGTYYLGYLMRKFDDNVVLAVASYNGGEGNVRRWVKEYGLEDIDMFIESIPYDETNEYVKKVLGSYGTYHRLATDAPAAAGE